MSKSARSNLFDVSMHLHHETARAILVSDDGNRDHAVWLPKEHVEYERTSPGVYLVTMPEWLAIERGLA